MRLDVIPQIKEPAVLSPLRTANGVHKDFFHGRNTLESLPLPAEGRTLLESYYYFIWKAVLEVSESLT